MEPIEEIIEEEVLETSEEHEETTEPEMIPKVEAEKVQHGILNDLQKLRGRLRNAESRLAEYEAMSQLGEEDPVPIETGKSPIDQWLEETADEDDAPIPASVYKQQREYEKLQRKQAEAVASSKQSREQILKSLTVAKTTYNEESMGQGLDFDTVVAIGSQYLTNADKNIIRAAEDQAGDETYNRCLNRAISSNTDLGDQLKAALESKTKAPEAPKPTPRKKPDPVPTPEEILGRATKPVALGSLGLSYGT